jgi:hypothetical protein
MNTNLDTQMYNTVHVRCKCCNNKAVATLAGLFCVRCNISLPDWMVRQ